MLELKPERLGIEEFTSQPLSICGKSFVADVSGALFWPSQNALIVADLEVAVAGQEAMRPGAGVDVGVGVGETLARLASVIDFYGARRVIVLGTGLAGSDQVADVDTVATFDMGNDDRKTLSIMQDHCSWTWVDGDGNADDGRKESFLGGQRQSSFIAEGIVLRHRPGTGVASHEIAGALRPRAKISRHGFEISRPCFISNGLRMILPAFATFVGGQNILGEAFEQMFHSVTPTVFLLGHEGLYPIAPRLLSYDAPHRHE